MEGQPRRFVRPGPNKPSGQVFPAETPRNPPETPQKPPGARPPEATNHGFGTQCQTPGRSDRPGRMDGWMDGQTDRPTGPMDGVVTIYLHFCSSGWAPAKVMLGRSNERKEARRKADSTLRSSQAVPHPSTNRALCCLTSEVERDPVHSTWYGRRRETVSP